MRVSVNRLWHRSGELSATIASKGRILADAATVSQIHDA
jgi:hypothetical protein